MKYKPIVFEKDKDGDQYIIIDHLSAEHCPIDRVCIDYIEKDNVSILCEHFTSLFQLDDNQFSHEGLYCNKKKKYCEVTALKPVKCQISRDSCLECEKLLNVIIDPYPEKSNCHVVCDAVRIT